SAVSRHTRAIALRAVAVHSEHHTVSVVVVLACVAFAETAAQLDIHEFVELVVTAQRLGVERDGDGRRDAWNPLVHANALLASAGNRVVAQGARHYDAHPMCVGDLHGVHHVGG